METKVVRMVARSLTGVPTDPSIARSHRPCGTAPLQACQDATVTGLDKVAQVGSDRSPIAEIAVALQELAEQALVGLLNQTQAERFQIGDGGLQRWLSLAQFGESRDTRTAPSRAA